jgi:hypothetical protein
VGIEIETERLLSTVIISSMILKSPLAPASCATPFRKCHSAQARPLLFTSQANLQYCGDAEETLVPEVNE